MGIKSFFLLSSIIFHIAIDLFLLFVMVIFYPLFICAFVHCSLFFVCILKFHLPLLPLLLFKNRVSFLAHVPLPLQLLQTVFGEVCLWSKQQVGVPADLKRQRPAMFCIIFDEKWLLSYLIQFRTLMSLRKSGHRYLLKTYSRQNLLLLSYIYLKFCLSWRDVCPSEIFPL